MSIRGICSLPIWVGEVLAVDHAKLKDQVAAIKRMVDLHGSRKAAEVRAETEILKNAVKKPIEFRGEVLNTPSSDSDVVIQHLSSGPLVLRPVFDS